MNVVSRRYAKALIQALPEDRGEAGLAQLRQLSDLLFAQPAPRRLLMNPAVPAQQRGALIERVSAALQVDAPVRRIFSLLVERRRLGLLGEICDACRKLLDDQSGTLRVQVTSAVPLAEDRQQAIVRQLERSTGKQIVLELEEDASIIGGLIVSVRGTVTDASVRRQLEGFQQHLRAE